MRDIEKDLERAEEALKSAQRNLEENDIFTAANRNFVACENAVYVLLKIKFGSSSISRAKILTRLKEISSEAKITYDNSYDLRVQADYGREARVLTLDKENIEKIIKETKKLIDDAKSLSEDN